MKVKNIMFSGFMAAVLAGACGAADAATVLASKEFVTTELGKKQDTLTAGAGIDITGNVVSSTYSDADIKADIQALETTVGATKETLGNKTIVEYIDEKTQGVNSKEDVSQLQTDVSAIQDKLAGLPTDKTVAQEIAAAVSDKVTTSALTETLGGYTTDTEYNTLAGRVTANEGNITDLQSTKADKTALDGYVTTDTLTTYQGTVSTALSGKASTGDVTALTGRVTTAEGEIDTLQSEMTAVEAKALANETAISNLDSTYAKDSEVATAIENLSKDGGAIATLTGTVAGIEADVEGIATELADVKATADAAQTAQQVKNTVEGYGYQTAEQVNTAIENKGYTNAIADAKKAGTDASSALTAYKAEMENTLEGKVDDAALDNYYTKSEADTQFLEDAGLEKGAAYLVTKDANGNVVYSEVSVIDGEGRTVIGKAQ